MGSWKKRIIIKNMGIFALVDYSLIKELCDNLKKDKKTFTGAVKELAKNNEGQASSGEKIDEVRRLLLSGKRKRTRHGVKGTRKRKEKQVEQPGRFRQQSSSGTTDTGSSTGSSDGNSSEDDINTDGASQSGYTNDQRTNTE